MNLGEIIVTNGDWIAFLFLLIFVPSWLHAAWAYFGEAEDDENR